MSVTNAGPSGLLRVFVLFHEAEHLGAGTSVIRVLDELAAYGWTASGWLPGEGALGAPARQRMGRVLSAERPLAFSFRGWRTSPGILKRARRTPAYLRAVREAIAEVRPHVVHANTLLTLPEATVARSCGLPVVLQSHEIPAAGAKTTATARCAGAVADVLVAVSDANAAFLRRHARHTPVLTVHSGVPVPTRALVAVPEAFTIGSVGTVSRTKGTDVLLRAARLVLAERPSVRFVHVGSSDLHRDAGLDHELRGLLADIRPPEAVAMLGALPAHEVMPSWDVFVSPSRSEAFPLATLEAMASGLPVVATTVGGVPEQIDHLESGILVRPDDPEALATWLIRLHDQPELRRRLGDAAAHRVRTRFTLARQADGLHRAYLTALNRRFGPSPVRREAQRAA